MSLVVYNEDLDTVFFHVGLHCMAMGVSSLFLEGFPLDDICMGRRRNRGFRFCQKDHLRRWDFCQL